MTSTILHPMAWTNERLCLSENTGLKKALLKMIVVENGNSAKSNNINGDFLTNRNLPTHDNMSLLKFFAINALELSAPASPVLLQQSNTANVVPPGWLQLSGHPESIAPTANGVVRKRVTGPTDGEIVAYKALSTDPCASKIVPKYIGYREIGGESHIELQDLLHGFKEPNVMDIKMGCRTFLESEVTNTTLRPDLYKKMILVDPEAPTEEEHKAQAVTKLRYMLFREQMSSSQTKGFRIEAMKIKGSTPITDLKTVKSDTDVRQLVGNFLQKRRGVTKELIKRLKQMRSLIEKSEYFKSHEVVGSSVFIVYDDHHVGAWMIDFAKNKVLPEGVSVDHRKPWIPGNCEEGLLHGMDELIRVCEGIYEDSK
ncbi:inositol-trisphosphate 3-kinase homolog isoform X1 [Phlebotomus argentipes]|uniref:inositol-trisphosphate 3-kinase homolog isoform X1 n=2 Tax=Phlebotomus argentipes TaxID=94469 RepID=UPI0028937E49|nr:inositol-trisphosphate 3-kinase homolog isoform X1 [Phlebotomus argentipes]